MSLRRNTLWNLVGSCAPFLLGVVTTPYLLRHIGVEAFGILTLVWSLIGYFSLFDFGLGRALTQNVAANRAGGQVEQLPSLVKTGLAFLLFAGAIGGILLAVLSNQLGSKWLNVSVSLQRSTVHALLIAALGIPLTTITAGLKGILEAYEDFKAVSILRMLLGATNFGFPVLSVMMFGPSLSLVVASLVAARLVVLGAHMYLVYRKLPAGWIEAKFNGEKMRGLLSFGAWMTVSNIVSPLMTFSDRFLVSAVLGAGLVAYYTVPSDVLFRFLIIPASLSAALFPRITSLMTTDRKEAKRVYEKCLKTTGLVMLPICLCIAIGSYWGLWLWLGKDFASHSWEIASILSLGILLTGIAQVPFATVQAAGNVKATSLMHVGEFVLYVPLLFLFLHYFGLRGVAIVWDIRAGADLAILLVLAKRCTSLSPLHEPTHPDRFGSQARKEYPVEAEF
jgi:O-antigen/teichoic acid export membrane protein